MLSVLKLPDYPERRLVIGKLRTAAQLEVFTDARPLVPYFIE